MIIYKIENNINGKIYIGLTTKDLSKRIAEHIAENKSYVQKALNKYGLQSFNISVIDAAESREALCEKEKYWIKFYDCKSPKGYNLTDGGDGLINPSKSVRRRIAKKVSVISKGNQYRKGIFHTVESKKAISEGMKNSKKFQRAMKRLVGKKKKPMSEEQKKKLSEARKGVPRSAEVRVLIAKNNRERVLKPGYVNPMKGKKRPDLSERNKQQAGKPRIFSNPEERGRKISESRKGKKYPRT